MYIILHLGEKVRTKIFLGGTYMTQRPLYMGWAMVSEGEGGGESRNARNFKNNQFML